MTIIQYQNKNKSWWRTVKHFLGGVQGVGFPSLIHQNRVYTDTKIKAQLFNDYFLEQCDIDDHGAILPDNNQIPEALLDKLEFNVDEIC